MRCLRTNGRMSRVALQKEAAGGSYARVIAELKTLQEKGLIAKVGSGPKVLYQVAGSGRAKVGKRLSSNGAREEFRRFRGGNRFETTARQSI